MHLLLTFVLVFAVLFAPTVRAQDPYLTSLPAPESPELLEQNKTKALEFSLATVSKPAQYDSKTFRRYIDRKRKFAFWYPRRWGNFTLRSGNECGEGTGEVLLGTFSNKTNVYVGSISKGCKPERGLTTFESIVLKRNPEEPSTTKLIGAADSSVRFWYNYPVGWETGDTVMAFEGKISTPLLATIAATGPVSNDPKLNIADVRDFATMARSFVYLRR